MDVIPGNIHVISYLMRMVYNNILEILEYVVSVLKLSFMKFGIIIGILEILVAVTAKSASNRIRPSDYYDVNTIRN